MRVTATVTPEEINRMVERERDDALRAGFDR